MGETWRVGVRERRGERAVLGWQGARFRGDLMKSRAGCCTS